MPDRLDDVEDAVDDGVGADHDGQGECGGDRENKAMRAKMIAPAHHLGRPGRGWVATEAGEQHLGGVRGGSRCLIGSSGSSVGA